MKQITECKKRVREMCRDFGYKKTTLDEHCGGATKVFYLFDGTLNVIVNDRLSFHFGEDKIFGCSAHICASGYDAGMPYFYAEEIFKSFLAGEKTEKEIIDYLAA